MKKTPLRRQSRKTAQWNGLYLKERRLRIEEGQVCQYCFGEGEQLHGHHYWTNRIDANKLRFVILCNFCHANTNRWLRDRGLLAEVNGIFSVAHPAVVAAEARFQEMKATLEGGD